MSKLDIVSSNFSTSINKKIKNGEIIPVTELQTIAPIDLYPVFITKKELESLRNNSFFNEKSELSIGYKIYETEYERN